MIFSIPDKFPSISERGLLVYESSLTCMTLKKLFCNLSVLPASFLASCSFAFNLSSKPSSLIGLGFLIITASCYSWPYDVFSSVSQRITNVLVVLLIVVNIVCILCIRLHYR